MNNVSVRLFCLVRIFVYPGLSYGSFVNLQTAGPSTAVAAATFARDDKSFHSTLRRGREGWGTLILFIAKNENAAERYPTQANGRLEWATVGIVAWGLCFAGEEHVGGVGGGDVVGDFVAERGKIDVVEDAFSATDEDG